MYLALRGFSAIHPGTMYDVGPFLTTGDIISPCKVQHKAKLLVDSKQTVLLRLVQIRIRMVLRGLLMRSCFQLLRHWIIVLELAYYYLPRGADDVMARGKVVKRARDDAGNPVGRANNNPILDTREYVFEFEDETEAEL